MNRNNSRRKAIFISSTARDLAKYRDIALNAVRALHLDCVAMENFEAGQGRPIDVCLRRIHSEADALVVIAAKRYGWVPSEDWPDLPDTQRRKSITWLECLSARSKGIQVIPFIMSENCPWPSEEIEEGRQIELAEFKSWLRKHHIAKEFSSEDDFRFKITHALDEWKSGEPVLQEPSKYFGWLQSNASRTKFSSGKHLPNLSSITGEHGQQKPSDSVVSVEHLFLAGEPGSGKSTFLAECASRLATNWKPKSNHRFPLFLVGGDFWRYVVKTSTRNDRSPTSYDSPQWIVEYLASQSSERKWRLSAEFFQDVLESENSSLIFDGFDQTEPKIVSNLISELTLTYPQCQVIVASRPWAILQSPGLSGFARHDILPLSNHQIRSFLRDRMKQASKSEHDVQQQANSLYEQVIKSRLPASVIRTPLLLGSITHELDASRDLPTNRAQLYERICEELVRPIVSSIERPSYDPLEVLQQVAWDMHSRQPVRNSASKRSAAKSISKVIQNATTSAALKVLESLADHSGLVVADGNDCRFSHKTFQEYLVARWLAFAGSEELDSLLETLTEQLTAESWRQVLLFLGHLLTDHENDIEALLKSLLKTAEDCDRTNTKARYVAALSALDLDEVAFPIGLRARFNKLVGAMHEEILKSGFSGIEMFTRLEIATAISKYCGFDKEFVWIKIPAAAFWMGAQSSDPNAPRYDESAHSNEKPVKWVFVKDYLMCKYPVTVGQFKAFVDDGGYSNADLWRSGGMNAFTAPLRWDEQLRCLANPVTGVSWYEAMAFCSWSGNALPTEAQWERAASGTDGRRYPWGNQPPNHWFANYDKRFGGLTPVGLFPEFASLEGVMDLAGNVWEWAYDSYGFYGEKTEVLNHQVESDTSARVLRGGSYQNGASEIRSSERIRCAPDRRYSNFGSVGFRCVKN